MAAVFKPITLLLTFFVLLGSSFKLVLIININYYNFKSFFAVFFDSTKSLECYVCNSLVDARCHDRFNRWGKAPVTCPTNPNHRGETCCLVFKLLILTVHVYFLRFNCCLYL